MNPELEQKTERGLFAAILLSAVLQALIVSPTIAQQDIGVSLDSPEPFTPTNGSVLIDAVVASDETIDRVAFYVDGMVVGELTEPPYQLRVDVGHENREHSYQVVAYGRSGATGSSFLTTPSYQIDDEVSVTLQQLYVTVTRDDKRVLDLNRDDFAIIDEGAGQQLITFARGDIPFPALVLLDSSLSMAGEKLDSALAGAKSFFTGMQNLDEGRLLVFSDRILHDTAFSTFPDVLTAGLGQVIARGGTALNDHLYLALKQLEARQGRRVVILLSDGVDSHSVLSMADVLQNARRSQGLIYWLRLPYSDRPRAPGEDLPLIASPWRSSEDYRREYRLLERTVAETGGRIKDLASVDEISDAFTEILAELREQYVLGFYPADSRNDGSWHRLTVRLRTPGVDVRCREGYVDF